MTRALPDRRRIGLPPRAPSTPLLLSFVLASSLTACEGHHAHHRFDSAEEWARSFEDPNRDCVAAAGGRSGTPGAGSGHDRGGDRLGAPDDPNLSEAVDLVLMVDTYHQIGASPITSRPSERSPRAVRCGSGGRIRGRASLAMRLRSSNTRSAANRRPPGYENGPGGRGFLNVLRMLRGYVQKVMELDRARSTKSPTAVPTHNRV
jgi:hypothetical protein